MTHIVLIDAIWKRIETYLIMTSAPSDGWIYAVKWWVLQRITEPILEVLYWLGLTTHKPTSALTPEDILGPPETDREEH